jgi:hypothetical protein
MVVEGSHAVGIGQVGGSSGVGADVGVAAEGVVVGAAAVTVAVLQEHSPDGVDSAEPVASFHVSNGLFDGVVAS